MRAADSAHVTIRDTVAAEAGGWTTIVATDRTHVRALQGATIEASGSARISAGDRVFVRARDAADVRATTDSVVEALDAATVTVLARATVRATDACRVRALASAQVTASGHARVWAWGRASVTALDASEIEAWGAATVMATGSGKVEARGSATVAAGGSVRVRAFGAAGGAGRGRAQIEATDGVSIIRHSLAATVSGGHVTDAVRFATPEEWCEYYGIDVDNGIGSSTRPSTKTSTRTTAPPTGPVQSPCAPDWDGGDRECGGGLHFSPRPTFALPAPGRLDALRRLPVRLVDMVVHPQGDYPDQVKARGVLADPSTRSTRTALPWGPAASSRRASAARTAGAYWSANRR